MGRVFMVQLSIYPSYVLIVGLWGGPYLTHVYGYDLKGRGDILFVAALAQVLGSFFWGPSDRLFGRYKVPILIGVGICFTSLALLAALGTLPIPLLLDRVRHDRLFDRNDLRGDVARPVAGGAASAGRTITLLNIGTMGGGFLVQFISGTIINLFPAEAGAYPLEAYRLVFALQAVLVLTGFIVYFGSRDSHLGRLPEPCIWL